MPLPAPASPAFATWFAQSAVVDAQGKPRVVYHGARQDFPAFDRVDGGNMFGPGYYFTESAEEASNYAVGKNVGRVTVDRGQPAVLPVFLSVQRPFDLKKELIPRKDLLALSRLADPAEPRELARRFDRVYQARDWNVWSALVQDHGAEGAVKLLRQAGYDGIHQDRVWVAFQPGQIKSAIGNLGKFDAANPDLCDAPSPLARWMAGSAVVDATGQPLLVYHGTAAKHLSAFEKRGGPVTTFLGSETVERHGMFFTDNLRLASEFARSKGADGRIVTAYLSVKKPLDLTNGFGPEVLGELERGGLSPDYFAHLPNDEMWSMFDGENGKDTVAALKRLGYDGVILSGPDGARKTQRSYVVFEPAQIKSALGDTGKYDPTNPDIYDLAPLPVVPGSEENVQAIRALAPPTVSPGLATPGAFLDGP